ncbi:hypothetical protein GCM10010522_49900 [Kribbella solani]
MSSSLIASLIRPSFPPDPRSHVPTFASPIVQFSLSHTRHPTSPPLYRLRWRFPGGALMPPKYRSGRAVRGTRRPVFRRPLRCVLPRVPGETVAFATYRPAPYRTQPAANRNH